MTSFIYDLLFMKLTAIPLYQLQILQSQASENLLEADSPTASAYNLLFFFFFGS